MQETADAPNTRLLKIVVLVLGLLLVGGFAVVIVTIAVRAGHPKSAPAAVPARDMTIGFDAHGRVERVILNGDRLVLDLADAAGRRLVVIDLAKGRTTDVIRLGASGATPSAAPAGGAAR